MGAPKRLTNTIEISENEGLAYIIGTPALLLTPMVYWQYDRALFGEWGLAKMFIITGVGGALSFALYAGRRRWFIGGLLGLAAGLGAAGAHLLYTGIFHREMMYNDESALVCIAGAAIPMALLGYVKMKDKQTENEKNAVSLRHNSEPPSAGQPDSFQKL